MVILTSFVFPGVGNKICLQRQMWQTPQKGSFSLYAYELEGVSSLNL